MGGSGWSGIKFEWADAVPERVIILRERFDARLVEKKAKAALR